MSIFGYGTHPLHSQIAIFEGNHAMPHRRVFGRRYRAVLKAWEASVIRSRMSINGQNGAAAPDRRINWSGQALSTFYGAVRKALVVVIVGRSIGILIALGLSGWWIMKRLGCIA
jgi:hypothetical protein